MTIYEIRIGEHNKKPHLDIEAEAQKIKNGLFTFLVRVFDGNIIDVVFLSYESYRSFGGFEEIKISTE